MNFNMKDGSVAPCTLSNVEKNKSLTFTGAFFKGMVKFRGDIVLVPSVSNDSRGGDDDNFTEINYTFGITGVA